MAGANSLKSAAALLCFFLSFLLDIAGQGTPVTTGRVSCPGHAGAQPVPPAGSPAVESRPTSVYRIKIVKQYPHDPEAFTQGLLFANGFLYESTGLNGMSGIRKVEFQTGRVLKKYDLPSQYFGEGLAIWKNSLIQLTWQSGKGFVYNLDTFAVERVFSYSTQGWGLTTDGESLIMSNGSNNLLFLNPQTFEEERVLTVLDGARPVKQLNELEFIRGEIFANIWRKDIIARISPQTGKVTGWIDMSDLRKEIPVVSNAEALNGIAYDAENDRIFVTGKYWPNVFQIEIVTP
ncbi:MAG: glutaminyl-peptide cyclotransferase [Syntrophobacteraceae bacterium]